MSLLNPKHNSLRFFGIGLLGFITATPLVAQVTTRQDTVGKLLNGWHAAGSAAGLSGITYENRDGGHSLLDVKAWPQLRSFPPAAGDTGPAHMVRPDPVIGNCSMSAPADKGGSLPRLYQIHDKGFAFLAAQYVNNNLFVYPEHQDHDPGWNGHGGWGDLYPANSPYITISQGSSFTDRPFVNAFLSATAALPPETQSLLISKRLLAPTLQTLLRRSYRPVKTLDDYFTGKAHPVVFDGAQIDEEKMVMLAHAMTPSLVPPVALLEIIGESAVVPNKDFFEPETVRDGRLATTPCSISRVFRDSGYVHEMLVSAERSADVQGRPLKFKWALLQGDLNRVRIEAVQEGARAKVAVAWHPEMRAVSGIQTHRVDIGVFAFNGISWSAPSFITFYMLPNEARFYGAKGRLEEICYEAGSPEVGLPPPDDLRWLALGRRLGSDPRNPGVGLLTRELSEVAVVRLQSIARNLSDDQAKWRELAADAGRKAEADKTMAAMRQRLRESLNERFDSTGRTVVQAFEDGLSRIADLPDLYLAGQDVIPMMVKESSRPDAWIAFTSARQRLVDYEIYSHTGPAEMAFHINPALMTAGERYHLRQFHLAVLNHALLPEFLERSDAPLFVDPRLTALKSWRDVYRYDKEGQPLGWTRFTTTGRKYEFNAVGELMPEGRQGRAVEVNYVRDTKTGKLVFAPK